MKKTYRSLTDVRLVIDGKLYCTEPTHSSLSPCMFCDLHAWCDARKEFENMCDELIADSVAFKKKKKD